MESATDPVPKRSRIAEGLSSTSLNEPPARERTAEFRPERQRPTASNDELLAAMIAATPAFDIHSTFRAMRPADFERLLKEALAAGRQSAGAGAAAAVPTPEVSAVAASEASTPDVPTSPAVAPIENLAETYRALWERNDSCELACTRQRLEITFLK